MKTVKTDLYEYFGISKDEGANGELASYIAEDYLGNGALRPAVLIMPGGAYAYTSPREAEPIALRFLSAGFNAFVLYYTVDKPFPTQLVEADLAMLYLRDNAEELGIKKDKIACIGFSAGGHLAATLGTIPCGYGSKGEKIVEKASGLSEEDLKKLFRPDALVLCYPVILTDHRSHKGSVDTVTGGDNGLIEALSLEKRVDRDTPPTFIWHTADDNAVPAINSIEFAKKLSENGVKYSLRIYAQGSHGISLCDEQTAAKNYNVSPDVCRWSDEAVEFLRFSGFIIG